MKDDRPQLVDERRRKTILSPGPAVTISATCRNAKDGRHRKQKAVVVAPSRNPR